MRSIDELIESAERLTKQGLSQGEIADELNVSRETAQWLVDQQADGEQETAAASPIDVHVDWSAIGQNSRRMSHLGAIMADMVPEAEAIDLTVGVGNSGGPLATVISQELDTEFSAYMPSKYQSNEEETATGSFSQNFATVAGRNCCIVDDNIDTGKTMAETIDRIREHGGEPRAAVVLTDKLGEDEIDGVPVYSLVKMLQMRTE